MSTATFFTRYASLSSLAAAPEASLWLTGVEHAEYGRLRDPSRRDQWMLARWLCKRMIAAVTCVDPREIEINSRQNGLGHRPRIRVHGRPVPWSLSISHTARGALVGFATSNRISVGVDLAGQVPSDDRFCEAWFSSGEQQWLWPAPPQRAAILWTLKEAAFKACNSGEPWSPRNIEIVPTGDHVFRYRFSGRLVRPQRVDIRRIDGQTAATVCVRRLRESYDTSIPDDWATCS